MKQTVTQHGNFNRVTTSKFNLEVHTNGDVYITSGATVLVNLDELQKALELATFNEVNQ